MATVQAHRRRLPWLLKQRSSRWFVTTVVAFASGTDVFMYGLIVPLTPTALKTRIGISDPREVQSWTSILLALFGVALLVTSPVVGYVADRAGSRRWPYLCSLLALGAATVILCVGRTIWLWVIARLFQGAASAVVWVVGNALMSDTLGEDSVGQGIGWTTMAASGGMLAGPLVGGVVYQYGGFYAVFGVAFGLIVIDLLLRLSVIEKRDVVECVDSKRSRMGRDTANTLEDRKTIPSRNPLQVALGRIMLLLRCQRIIIAIWGSLVVSVVMSSFDSVLPLFVRQTFGWKQSGQGLIFLPIIIPHILSPVAGSVVDRFPRAGPFVLACAFLCFTPPMVLLRYVTGSSTGHKILLCVLLTCIGICIAITFPLVYAEAFAAVKKLHEESPEAFDDGGAAALGFGLVNIGFATGGIIGPFFAGFIRQSAGWGTMGWALGLLAGATSVPAFFAST